MPAIEKQEIKPIDNKKLIFMFLAIIALLTLLYFLFFKKDPEINLSTDCYITKQRTVDGISMLPLLKDKEVVTTFENYYNCNEIKKGDIVIFNFKTREGDYIKRVLGMPNDVLEFEGGYIKINGEYATNSTGDRYQLNNIQKNILKIPLTGNQIPRNGYLILGDNVSEDTFDSRQFGYINKDQIIGKVNK